MYKTWVGHRSLVAKLSFVFTGFGLVLEPSLIAATQSGQHWPGFRGNGSSHSQAVELPLHWSESENLAWTAQLDGFGQSGPVIWEDKVFVTSVISDSEAPLAVACFFLTDGRQLWSKRFKASQINPYTRMYARAAPTPAVDASGLVVFFSSGDLMKLSHGGEVLWSRSLVSQYGEFKGNHGVASSPVLHDHKIFLLIAHEGPSYVVAIDNDSGETLWKTDRKEAVSWTSPLVIRHGGQDQLIISSNGTLEALDTTHGKRIWFTEAIAKNTVPSPSLYGNLVIAASSEVGAGLAVKLGGKGDITDSHIQWRSNWPSSFGSPLVKGNQIYFGNRAGVVASVDGQSGAEIWRHRLGDACWASPVAAGKRLYFFAKNGHTVVMAADTKEPRVLAENKLPVGKDDEVYGVALVDRKILIRTGSALTCIAIQP